jgi:hypothetical protein
VVVEAVLLGWTELPEIVAGAELLAWAEVAVMVAGTSMELLEPDVTDEVALVSCFALPGSCHAQIHPVSPFSVEQTWSDSQVRSVPYCPP